MGYFRKGLTFIQNAAFEQVAIGNDSGINSKTADALIKKGLIERHEEKRGVLKIYRYQVPIPIHMEWCKWCSENIKDEE